MTGFYGTDYPDTDVPPPWDDDTAADETEPVTLGTVGERAAELATQDDEPDHDAAREVDGKAPASTRLVRLAEARYRLAATPTGEPFAVPLSGPPVAQPLRGGRDSMRAQLAELFYDEHGKAPTQQALADALLVLEGRATRAEPEELHLRVAEHHGALWLDLGDDTGRAVKITPAGWTVELPPVLYRRTALTGPLPEPVAGGDLAQLWPLLNVAEADRPLVLAVLVAELLPDIPHPVVSLGGEQGTGKSTASRTLAALLDPSPAQLRKPPRDVESWTTAAAGSWVVAVDNLSGLPDWLSDALCRAATGDGDVRRRLYTDADLHVIAFRRCVILNGIDLGAVRDDLADRLVSITLDRITDRARKYDADLARQWERAHPRVLGAVLDLAARVLAAVPTVHLPDPPRMADFGRVLAAVDAVLGTEGMARYRAQAGDLAADAVSGDPVLAALTAHLTAPWEGAVAELLDRLTDTLGDARPPREWPKSARVLAGILKRRAPSLRRLGWTVEQTPQRTERGTVWRLSPPAYPWPTNPDETADETADEIGSSGSRQDSRQEQAPILTCEDAETGRNPDEMTTVPSNLSVHLRREERNAAPAPTYRGSADSSSSRQPVTPTCPCGAPVWAPQSIAAGRCGRCVHHDREDSA